MASKNSTNSSILPGCDPLDDGDTSFMIMAATFVMLQTPALGLAQAGIIRRKNALSMLMQTLTGFAIGSILWFLCGFSLTFGNTISGFVGDLRHSFLQDVSAESCFPNSTATTIPGILFACFQLMFAVMVPVIVTGAWAERMLFEAFLVFVTVWPFLVYYPLAHWVWNTEGFLASFGVVDFAGGLTIHTSSGVAAFAVTLVLSDRLNFHRDGIGHHNLPMAIVGGALIWGGWYSFNGGSAFKANAQAAMAVMNTHISACSGALVWMLLAYRKDGHWHLTEIMNGAYAGLACVTPGSGFILPQHAFLTGIFGSLFSYLWIEKVKLKFRLDDALDVTALQGIPGIIGTVCVGLFATGKYNPVAGFFVSGSPELLGKQLIGIAITVGWTFLMTYILMVIMKKTVGIDVSPEVEEQGLDLVQIGEQAYDESLAPVLDLGIDHLTSQLCEASKIGDLPRVKSLLSLGAKAEAVDYDKRSPLHLSASEGHYSILKYLLTRFDTDINCRDRFGNTPLADAVKHNRKECVELLKKHGGVIFSQSGYFQNSSIHHAVFEGNYEEVLWILDNNPKHKDIPDYDLRTPLHIACSEGHEKIVKLLLQKNAKTNVLDRWDRTPYFDAIHYHHAECGKLLRTHSYDIETKDSKETKTKVNEKKKVAGKNLQNVHAKQQEQTPLLQEMKNPTSTEVEEESIAHVISPLDRALLHTVETDDPREFKRLIGRGADINAKDYDERSVLHVVCSHGSLKIAQLMVNDSRTIVDVYDRFGNTPLQDAINHGHTQIAKILRASGATIKNPLIASKLCELAAQGNLEELKQMEAAGHDISVSDYDGRTALHLAVCANHINVVAWLLKVCPQSLKSYDRYGNTALDDAMRYDHHDIIQLIQQESDVSIHLTQ